MLCLHSPLPTSHKDWLQKVKDCDVCVSKRNSKGIGSKWYKSFQNGVKTYGLVFLPPCLPFFFFLFSPRFIYSHHVYTR